MVKIHYLLFLFWFFSSLGFQQLIIIMGPSCAGKSTFAKSLCKRLKACSERWIIVGFDEVGENLERLIDVTNNYLNQNINVIIDTNTYHNIIEEKIADVQSITRIKVIAPLEVLLERDAKRTKNLQRTAERALQCRNFVIKSFKRSLFWTSDIIIDSSCQTVQQATDAILQFLEK